MGSRNRKTPFVWVWVYFRRKNLTPNVAPLNSGGGVDWECTYPWKCSPKPKAQICHMWKYILIEKLVISYHALSVFIYIHQKLFVKKNHVRLKSPYHVSNPELGSFSKRVLRLICLCSTGAIVIGCPS